MKKKMNHILLMFDGHTSEYIDISRRNIIVEVDDEDMTADIVYDLEENAIKMVDIATNSVVWSNIDNDDIRILKSCLRPDYYLYEQPDTYSVYKVYHQNFILEYSPYSEFGWEVVEVLPDYAKYISPQEAEDWLN